MSLSNIIILVVVLGLGILLIGFLIFVIKKQKKVALQSLIRDLNIVNEKYEIKPLSSKELPVNLEESNSQHKSDIYFCEKAVIGLYEHPNIIINDKNINITKSIKNNKLEIFYGYYIFKFKHPKLIPLNKIDVLITQRDIHLYHPLEPEKINLAEIKTLTFFWEKNPLIKSKTHYPAVSFNYKNKHYFLLFQTYNEALKFIMSINKLHK